MGQQDCEVLSLFRVSIAPHWAPDTSPLAYGVGSVLSLAHINVFFSWQGKFIRINFDVTGYIVGANIETCILC